MDGSFPEPAAPGAQEHKKGLLVSLITFAGIIKWLAGLIKFTEEEREADGIYFDRPTGE